jgi:hypothetical protein
MHQEDSAMHHIVNTNKEVPRPRPDARSIVALIKDSGHVEGYELSDGSSVSREEGVRMAREGRIKGVAIAQKKDTEYLRSLPDDSESNNLGSLPSHSVDSFFMEEEWERDMSGERPYGESAFGESPLSQNSSN